MVAAMVKDVEIMGLCGETKIANKSQSWVTMIQVFEYFISHHLTKSFESVFGGVTCLPGCFSMYSNIAISISLISGIKAPKGEAGFFVPILANPDVVSRYQEDKVDTLHKKNLLLLGEDRYLTTLMLKTFPHRKQIFVPNAVCKTIVPDTFKVLLSQRRRWINSTVHNLMELFLVRDLCGTFCFSMQVRHNVARLSIVCRVYRVSRDMRFACRDWVHGLCCCHRHCSSTCADYSTGSPRTDSRITGSSNCVDCQTMVLCRMDAYLPLITARMELSSTSLCILELRRFLLVPLALSNSDIQGRYSSY